MKSLDVNFAQRMGGVGHQSASGAEKAIPPAPCSVIYWTKFYARPKWPKLLRLL
ncbi:MAG: hypothetical protein K2Y28_01245 [Burkholderiaceae bacterium]|nr:hypothetical protein [Burkholderiaceae bacterium]